MLKGYVILKMFFSRCLLKIFCAKTLTETWRHDSDLNFRHPLCYDSTSIKIFTPRSMPRLHIPTNTPYGFYVETTWKRPFPRRFNVESTECVCRNTTWVLPFMALVFIIQKRLSWQKRPFITQVSIIQKPVHWFAEQINELIFIW